jgi:glycosyltransferase involved in cell wall biosynthesis
MRVLILSTDYLPLIGGVAQHVSELARALVRAGDDVEVVTVDRFAQWRDFQRPTRTEEATPGEPRVIRVPYVINRSVRFLSGQLSSRASLRRYHRAVQARLLAYRPDVLHWHAVDGGADRLARGFAGARVWTNHTSDFITGLRRATLRARYRAEARAADRIIAPSEELRDLTVALGLPAERVTFIPNGVNPARFGIEAPAQAWRERLALQAGEQVVLCPRRLDPKNGVAHFVDAALRLAGAGRTDARFVIAGDASGVASAQYAREILRRIRTSPHAGRFALLGAVDNTEIAGLYALSSLVVIPSLIEATSIAALEAMASGRPLVASRVGGLPFLVRDGENGLLVPPAEPAALAAAMARLLDDPALRAACGAIGRTRIERELSWDPIAARTRAIYAAAQQERQRA